MKSIKCVMGFIGAGYVMVLTCNNNDSNNGVDRQNKVHTITDCHPSFPGFFRVCLVGNYWRNTKIV